MLATAVAIHLYIFNNLPMQFDELLMYEVVNRYSLWKLIPYLYVEEIQGPLGYVILKFFMLFGQSTFVMRLPSLLFLFLTPWSIYKLARLTMDKDDALKTCALLMFFLPVFMFSGSMRPYMGYVFFTALTFYQFLNPERKIWALILSLLGLFFIHPLGAIIAYVLSGVILLKKKEGRNLFLGLTAIGVLFATIAVLFRHQSISDLLVKFNFKTYYRALYNFSFLISGREFFAFVMLLLSFIGFQKIRKKEVSFRVDKIWLHAFGWSILASLFLMIFFGKHVYPRHFMFLLPALAIIIVSLINSVTTKIWLRNVLLVVGVLLLSYKTLVKEQFATKPYEIDSKAIAEKSSQLSEGYSQIVSCGNCFRYYIKDQNLECTGSHLPHDYFANYSEAVYIELDYVKSLCGLDRITQKYEIVETTNFIGGKVHKLIFPGI